MLSTAAYLVMGWLVLVAAISGGVACSADAAFFAAPRLSYGHFVWHLFVIAGSACHFVAVLGYAA